jgi:hypothetical protein
VIAPGNRRDVPGRLCDHHGVNRTETRAFWQVAADLIRADLEATTALRWPLLVELDGDHLAFNHGTSGNYLPDVEPFPSDADLAEAEARGELPAGSTLRGLLSAQLADMVNEDVMEHLERPWPECPVHQRPMDPIPVGPTGTWQCSLDPAHAVPIGGLAGMVGPSGLLEFT